MNKSDLQTLSKVRINEANVLLKNKHYNGAYYLAGYAVECAIKACWAGRIRNNVVPERDFGDKFYQHNLEKLMRNAGLWTQFEKDMNAEPLLKLNWAIVKDWSEVSRYRHSISPAIASDLYKAITARKFGILGWVKKCI